jgi:hypothetical protein
MRHLRKSPGLIALLVYALLLNALAFSAATAHVLDSSAWCASNALDRPSATQKQDAPHATHDACVLACAASGHLTLGAAFGVPSPRWAERSIAAVPPSTAAATLIGFGWQARAPPAA